MQPGMPLVTFADITKLEIRVDTQLDALAVPEDALRYRDGKPGVVVRGDGWREVVLGRTSAGRRIVEAGLEEGEEVSL